MRGGLLILRHAQSTWNALGIWQGWADPPLSDEGVAQCRTAARGLRDQELELVVTSDLTRARQTGALLVPTGTPTTIDPGIREYDIGEWSGLTSSQIEATWPGAISQFASGGHTPPGGEDRKTFDDRVRSAAMRVAQEAGDKRLLVVAHGGVLRAVARFAGRPEYRVAHLTGWWGYHDERGLFPEVPVDLVNGSHPPDDGEATAVPGREPK